MAEVEDRTFTHLAAISESSSSSSSSSDEEVIIKKKGGWRASRSLLHGPWPQAEEPEEPRSPRSFCSMALDEEKEGHKGSSSDNDSDSDVSITEEEILEILEDNR